MIETATKMDAPSRSRERISRYATAAKVAAAIPAAMLAANADATIYSQTGLSVTVGSSQTVQQTIQLTGAGGAVVGTLRVKRALNLGGNFSWATVNIGAGLTGRIASFQAIYQYGSNDSRTGGLPVAANATWNSLGRTAGQFKGTSNSLRVESFGNINFATTGATSNSFNFDPQGVGNTGATWHLLFQFTSGAAMGNYGWISFTANVNGFGNSSLTFTGWGWDDSGATIGAGVTASAVPGGTGLAALAIGAAGLRGRRRSRVA